jgi:EmrB/QacA subfamily drug resistance transporter
MRDLRHSPDAPPRVSGPGRLALPVLLTGTCLIVLDFFIVNVALTSLQRDLGAGPTALEWVVAGYGLTFAVLLLAAGRLGDRYGRRRTLGAGVALFTVASLLCGLAPSAPVLVAARLLQGAGGALISPTVLAFLGVLYHGPARARAIGSYATAMGLAAAGGQLVGGLLLQADVAGLGWRAIFLVNVPVGLALALVLPRALPESRAAAAAPLDPAGLALATLSLTALVLPLVDGREQGWPAWAWCSLGLSPVLLAGFVLRQRAQARRGGVPLVDPRWFGERTFRVGAVVQLVFWCGQASYFLVLALWLQAGRGLSALEAGLVFSVLAGAYLASSLRAGALQARFGRAVVVTGALLMAAGHGVSVLAVASGGGVAAVLPGLVLTGTGMGLCLAPITATILASVDPQRAGAVSGLLSTLQQVGNAVGVAVVGLVFFAAAGGGYDRAFELGSALLAALLVVVAACAARLPGRRAVGERRLRAMRARDCGGVPRVRFRREGDLADDGTEASEV